ncbi:MAG TPA: HAMP domain-containing histidine kinase [bacterium]|nr:HAMP domain-containing histidine kinase [bacterium]
MDIFEGRQAIRERLLSDATHRMKNIMGGISGFAALILKDLDEGSHHYPLVERIQENVIRLDQFLLDVMTLVRERTMYSETIDLPSTVRDVCVNHYADPADDNPDYPFKIESSPSRIPFRADPLLIRNGLYHALQIVDALSSKIETLRIESDDAAVSLRYIFVCDKSLNALKEDILAGLGSIESVDIQLSLAVCLKLMRMHQGEVQIDHLDGKRWIFLLRFSLNDR